MSLQPSKTDPVLGREIEEHFRKLGIGTPTNDEYLHVSSETKINQIEVLEMKKMQILGLDINNDSLMGTPLRVAKMNVNEIYWGLMPDNFPKCTVVENAMHYDEMVCEKNITVMSACEHHFVVIDGLATVAYIPNQLILGLSKINRVVEYFSRRPQIQERLTVQIAEALKYILKTQDVAVVIDAEHYCVKSRGVEDYNSSTVTSCIGGVFKTIPEVRAEFMSLRG